MPVGAASRHEEEQHSDDGEVPGQEDARHQGPHREADQAQHAGGQGTDDQDLCGRHSLLTTRGSRQAKE
jgi:hypothetical protein